MRRDAESWLKQAKEDLRFAEAALKEGFFSWACFVSQQAVEKSLKSYLIEQTGTVQKTHRLLELARQAERTNPGLARFREPLDVLNQYYGPTRYADLHGGEAPYKQFTVELATEALDFARTIVAYMSDQSK